MSFSLRLFLGVLVLVSAALWISFANIRNELAPGMRQSLEEVLVDTSNLLAVMVSEELANGSMVDGSFAKQMESFAQRRFNAVIYTLQKKRPSLVVYVTDVNGTVVYDSRGIDVGVDYSRWNDVYKTLRGEYGARSTRVRPDDDASSVMYVAAPVEREGELIGVLSVGKPSAVVTPFVEAGRRALLTKSAWLLALAFIVAALLSFGLTGSVRKLTGYAEAVREEKRVAPPKLREPELVRLAAAMESMRVELDGKQYVEKYLHGLTHELKSPLAAIEGAAELLDEEMSQADREKFLGNIRNESARLREIVERLLLLSAVEGRTGLEQTEIFQTASIVADLCEDQQGRLARKQLGCDQRLDPVQVEGETFLIRQAVSNLLENAIEFSPAGGRVELVGRRVDNDWELSIRDQGPGIPSYAQERLFERFYSLPRPGGQPKSTGLGLTSVREIAQLHQGSITVRNHPEGGAVATFRVPVRQKS